MASITGYKRRPRSHYRGRPLSELSDRRLYHLSSPRCQISNSLRAGVRVEMGWRMVFGSSPEEVEQRDADRQVFEGEEMPT